MKSIKRGEIIPISEIDYQDMPPSSRTMKQINEVFRDKLGGYVVTQVDHANGLLEFWNVNGRMVIVHAYRADDGWTHYPESRLQGINEIVKDLY